VAEHAGPTDDLDQISPVAKRELRFEVPEFSGRTFHESRIDDAVMVGIPPDLRRNLSKLVMEPAVRRIVDATDKLTPRNQALTGLLNDLSNQFRDPPMRNWNCNEVVPLFRKIGGAVDAHPCDAPDFQCVTRLVGDIPVERPAIDAC
jgi:hypothetical protein